MIHEIVYAAKYFLGKDIVEREFGIYPDDTFLVSYPRSGNTWTRFLLANLIHPDKAVTLQDIEYIIPDTPGVSKKFLKSIPRPRLLKSHQYFDPRYKKVIYIVRDPRDVALSHHRDARKYGRIDDDYPIDRWVTAFVAGEVSGLGSWAENVLSWLTTRYSNPAFLLLRYEDMKAETARELARVASFLGIDATPERLAQAVERSSADRMRKLEKTEGDAWVMTKKGRKDVPFVGAAKVGGWTGNLSEKSVLEIESAWGPLMKALGYDLTRHSCTALEPPYFLPKGKLGGAQ